MKRLVWSGLLAGLGALATLASTRLAAVIPFYGRHDLVGEVPLGGKLADNLAALFARPVVLDRTTEAMLREASPLDLVRPGLPPFLLVHGTADASVPYVQSVALQARLRVAGVPCDLITIKDGAHGMINWDKVAPDYKAQVIAWLNQTLKIGASPATP